MTDAEIAGIFAIVGIGLSGSIQTALAVREDHRSRRALARMVSGELNLVAAATRGALIGHSGTGPYAPVLPDVSAFTQHQQGLARELTARQWEQVNAAYGHYALLRSVANRAPENTPDVGRRLTVAFEAARDASVALQPWHRRWSGRKAYRAIEANLAVPGGPAA